MSGERAHEAIRAAFVFSGGASHWTGGFNYLRNALRVLRLHESARLQPVLFLAPEVSPDDTRLLASEVVEPPIRAEWLAGSRRGARFRKTILTGSDAAAAHAFRRERIDVAFEAGEFFGLRFPVPALTWVADFQSHHLPQFFSWRARWRTYLGRRLQLMGRRMILLSSRDAERDCHRFLPRSRGRTLVVPFAIPQPAGLVADPAIPRAHGLPDRYFYLPNQFWQHKNHRVVIEALAIARAHAPEMAVAASGSTIDHRDPGFYDELRDRVGTLGLDESFRFLGLVPATDVPQLALQSVAIVNPSLFEGWSTTVEEGKSLGVPLVLSGIGVHREQAGDRARYFDPHSASAAASALLDAWRAPSQCAAERLAAAREDAAARSREFAAQLSAALAHAAKAGAALPSRLS
jgi:glycosyltransferase involved in cell wall biosynthesis